MNSAAFILFLASLGALVISSSGDLSRQTPSSPSFNAYQSELIYAGCGVNKTCLGMPDNCITSQSCNAITTVIHDEGRYFFEIMSGHNNPVYISAAISKDAIMAEDSVIECLPVGGIIQMFASWTVRGPFASPRVPSTHLRLVEASYHEGTVYCKVEMNAVSTIMGKEFNLVNDKFHLMLATGLQLRENSIGAHDIGRAVASEAVNLSIATTLTAASMIMTRLHGAFMVIAWMGTASVGIILARYFKQTWSGSLLCGKDQWFAWHRLLMILTWLLTMAGFVLIFVEIKGWSQVQNPHAVLGVLTTAACFVQPFAATFRPGPKSKMRPLFNWSHWLGGNLAHTSAIMTIFYTVRLSRAQLPEWLDMIFVAYVAYHVIVHSIFSFQSKRTIYLIIYLLGILAFVVTVVTIIFLAPI